MAPVERGLFMRYFMTAAVLFVCSLAVDAGAGKVYFANGDVLTGKIKMMTENTLTVESELAGEVTVPMDRIRTLTSEEPVEVHFEDGTVIDQKIEQADEGQIAITTGGSLQGQSFEIAKIASINPPEPEPPAWHGSASVGVTSTHGNTRIENRSASFEMNRRGEKDRITLGGDYARSEQEGSDDGEMEVTENWWRLRSKYDYFFAEKWYGYLSGSYEKDSIADLDRRVIIGTGAGYQWVESKAMNFSTEAGLASVYERFEGDDDSKSELSAQLGYHFDKLLGKENKLKFINDLTYFPAMDDPADYYLTTTAELRAPITEQMFTNFKVVFDYDSTPASGADKTDVKYILGAGINW